MLKDLLSKIVEVENVENQNQSESPVENTVETNQMFKTLKWTKINLTQISFWLDY